MEEERFVFLYKATFNSWDEKDHCIDKNEYGLIYATGYKDVFNQLNDMYGDDLIDISIWSMDCYAPLRFNESEFHIMKSICEKNAY